MPRKREPASPALPEGHAEAQSPREGVSPDAERSAGSRERILDAAMQLFASRGFDATPTKEIAGRAGVPSGLVFYYFPRKLSILLTIIEERGFLPELRAIIRDEIASQDDPRVELMAVGVAMIEFLDENKELMRILIHEALSHPEVAAELRAIAEESDRLVAEYLRAEARLGRLRQVDADVLARLFTAGVLVRAFERPADAREEVRKIVDTLLRGLVVERLA